MSADSTIPQPRVIVLCFDGTANQYSAQNTNVVKFYGLLDKSCPLDQIVYYQPGVGTYFNPGVVSPALTWIAKILDEAIAWYLSAHVMGGYKFLMENYRSGDKICIFGFSRGAYTARALAGFLFKIGLLPKDNVEQVPFAYNLYKRTDDAGLKIAVGFKQTFCRSVTVDFLGVWDTVASVGLIYGPSLPFTSANAGVRVFRHALSLDERRARFQPNLYHRESPQDASRRNADPNLPIISESDGPESAERTRPRPRPRFGFPRWGVTVRRHTAEHQHEIPGTRHPVPSDLGPEGPPGPSSTVFLSSEPLPPVLEVWFAGCHSDVGGSAVPDTERYSLADVTLRWMVKQVILCQCGIRFDDAALRRADIDFSTLVLLGPTQMTTDGTLEAEVGPSLPSPLTSLDSPADEGSGEDMLQRRRDRGDATEQAWPRGQDVVADIHDQLKIKPVWWLLEILPVKFVWQDPDGTWKSKWGVNFGRGRQVKHQQRLYFHDTVRERMATPGLNYTPRAKYTPGSVRYID